MVYFIQEEETNFVKIGFTRSLIRKRVTSLQIGNPRKLHLLNVFGEECCDERQCHLAYSKYHIRGEWFKLPDSVIRSLKFGRIFGSKKNKVKRKSNWKNRGYLPGYVDI